MRAPAAATPLPAQAAKKQSVGVMGGCLIVIGVCVALSVFVSLFSTNETTRSTLDEDLKELAEATRVSDSVAKLPPAQRAAYAAQQARKRRTDSIAAVAAQRLANMPAFEITTWSWRKDPDFTSDGATIWTGVVRNNTSRYVERVRVEFMSFDAADRIVDTDFGYATGLSPGGTASVKGYATYFGTEQRASLTIKP